MAKKPMSLSTATLEELPGIQALRKLTKSLAMLDAIVCPEWESRYYSYNSQWAEGEEMASMRNGCGDDWFLLFDINGAALKGFAHEYPLATNPTFVERIRSEVPSVFKTFLQEPAFCWNRASFCIWRRHADPQWRVVSPPHGSVSPDQDGSAELISILDGKPESYRNWAVAYYEREISLSAVRAVYNHRHLNDDLVNSLNSSISLRDIQGDALEIGYPTD